MAYDAEFNRRTQMSLIEMNDKLEKVLNALTSLETKVDHLEEKLEERKLPGRKPTLPPKPANKQDKYSGYIDFRGLSPTYEQVSIAPALPYRKRGKSFSTNQLEYMQTELCEVKQYVSITKNKDENEKMKIIGSLNCLIGSLQPPPGTR